MSESTAPQAVSTPEVEPDIFLPPPRPEELAAVVEALLFAATQPLTIKRLRDLTSGTAEEDLRAAIADFADRYDKRRGGLIVMEVAGGYQLATRPEYADWILALHRHRKKNPISPALLETLAIVAYKQPIVRAEIEAIRGVDCGGVMRALQDSGLVEVVGTREVPGRPSLYGTTELFLKTFGLRELGELPSLADLHHILSVKMREKAEEEEAEDAAAESPEAPAADGDSTEPSAPEQEEELPSDG